MATGQFPTNPGNYTGLRVYCRNLPAAGRQLTGTYQLMNQTTMTVATGVVTGGVAWSPAYTARREFSHMLTLVRGWHLPVRRAHRLRWHQQPRHQQPHRAGLLRVRAKCRGPDANNTVGGNKIRFTIHVDGNTDVATILLPAGLSSTEGPRTVGTGCSGVVHRVLANVQLGTGSPRTITGAFGPDGYPPRQPAARWCSPSRVHWTRS